MEARRGLSSSAHDAAKLRIFPVNQQEQQRTLQEWNAKVKGQYIQRQQAYQQRDIHAKREQTSYERKEEEWHKSDITTAKGGDVQGGNIDNWLAKQSNN